MINGKDLGGTGHELIARLWKTTKKSSIRRASAMAKIQTEYLLNMSPQHCCYTKLLGVGVILK
jgi:hypothetical protein